jgi:hypothetical protein
MKSWSSDHLNAHSPGSDEIAASPRTKDFENLAAFVALPATAVSSDDGERFRRKRHSDRAGEWSKMAVFAGVVAPKLPETLGFPLARVRERKNSRSHTDRSGRRAAVGANRFCGAPGGALGVKRHRAAPAQ